MPATQSRPNVIIVIMDDLCYGDLACHGNPIIRTPNLDAMHAASARLTRYCSGPLCSPARASVMTGRYHLRTRVLDTYCGRSMLDPDEKTIAQVLKLQGYATGAFGKWHLGDCYPNRAMDLGFDETLMHKGGGIGQPGDHHLNYAREHECYFDPMLHRNGVPEKCEGYCTDIFFDAAMRFIQDRKDEPFFVYLATNAPHTPLIVADKWADPYRALGVNDTHARLYGMVENIDWNMGRLDAHLRRLGLMDNTIVVYTSDHGPCGSARNPDAPDGARDRYNAGLRGIKGSVYEGGIRVPCFWRWPGRFQAGVSIDRIAHAIDILPTLAAVCGANLPVDRKLDGKDLTPLLTGAAGPREWPERALFMQWHRGDVPERFRNYAVITQRYKLTRPIPEAEDELYDLQNDPGEQGNLVAEHPGLAVRMRGEYEAWLDEMGATRGPGTFDPPPIHVGTDHEPCTVLSRNDWRLHGQEGWRRNDLRGHWELLIRRPGVYRVRVRFAFDPPAGEIRLMIDEQQWSAPGLAGREVVELPPVRLQPGRARLEAWKLLEELTPGCMHQRFMPAMWVEIEGL